MNIPLKRYWDLLADHIVTQKGRFALLLVSLLGSIGLQVFNPQIMRDFIDAASQGAEIGRLARTASVFLVLALLQQAIAVGATYIGENVAWTATNALRAELARHCLGLDMRFHNNITPGELIERIDGDVTELSNFFSQLVVRVIGNLILLAGILVALAFEDWRVGLAVTGSALVTLYGLNRVRGIAIPHDKALRAANADLFGFLEEQLAGTEDICACGAAAYGIQGLYRHQREILGHWRRAGRMYVVLRAVGGLLLWLVRATPLITGYYLFTSGAISLGTTYLIVYYTNLLARPIRELNQQVESLQNIGASTERLTELQAERSHLPDGPGADLPTGPLSLAFQGVRFAYAEDAPVLQDLTFELAPGTVLGLLGRTGSGKTTLARLVFRLYDPTVGQVTLGGVDLRQPPSSAATCGPRDPGRATVPGQRARQPDLF